MKRRLLWLAVLPLSAVLVLGVAFFGYMGVAWLNGYTFAPAPIRAEKR